MSEFQYRLTNYDVDVYGFTPPSTLFGLAVDASTRSTVLEGIPGDRLMDKLGGVWMLARLRYTQSERVLPDTNITAKVSPRFLEGGIVVRTVDIIREDGSIPVTMDMAFAAVNAKERRIIRAADVEPLWNEPSIKRGVHTIARIGRYDGDKLIGVQHTRFSDCDANGHMAAPGYVSLICELCGFWGDGPRLMRRLALDFSVECPAGTDVTLFGETDGDVRRLRAEHDGRISFTSECVF